MPAKDPIGARMEYIFHLNHSLESLIKAIRAANTFPFVSISEDETRLLEKVHNEMRELIQPK